MFVILNLTSLLFLVLFIIINNINAQAQTQPVFKELCSWQNDARCLDVTTATCRTVLPNTGICSPQG
eukprot:Pgem_evm1s10505